ncbi:MAG: hypothetical protein M1828_006200 [Chrysothrix sp. TS-e1954]|nr:MAG: hypothetical protein M1828_006200 [Chrysothrix sp. TS-e1954]
MQYTHKSLAFMLSSLFPFAHALPATSTASAAPAPPSPSVSKNKNVISNDAPSGYYYARDGGNYGQIGSTSFTLNCDTLQCPKHKPKASCPYVNNNSMSFLTGKPGVVHDPASGGRGLCAKNTDTGKTEHIWFGSTLSLSDTQGLSYLINVTVGPGESWRNTAPVVIDISNPEDPTCTRVSNSWWNGIENQATYGGSGAVVGQAGTADAGYWYIYGNGEDAGDEKLAVYVARVKPADAKTQSDYQYWDGSSWQSDQTKAVTVLSGGLQGSISYNAHLGGYLYLYSYINYIQARFAYHPQGPWSDVTSLFNNPGGVIYAPVALPNFDASGKTTELMYSNHAHGHQQQIVKVTWP